jgi:hypothetical protein
MTQNQYIVIFYILFWVIRINGCIRRGRQPLLRGPEWFFKVHVQPGFYGGPGKKILRHYWMRMLIPFAFDIPVATAIFISGHLQLLNLLILALVALIHINHAFSVGRAERQARPFAFPEDEQPVSAMVFSLKTRRLRDYSNRKLEIAMALSSAVALAWLVRYYFVAPDHHNLRMVFGVPVLFLYIQAGFLFAKLVVVAWRAPAPQVQAEAHLAAREARRKYYLKLCDFSRIAYTIMLLSWPISLSATTQANRERIGTIWLVTALVLSVVATVWQEIKRKKLLTVTLRARPVKLPDFLGQSGTAMWPLCYQPSAPMSVLKGARGYSLNLANTLTQLGAAYLAGLVVVLMVLLRAGR